MKVSDTTSTEMTNDVACCWVALQPWEVGQSCQSLSSYPSSIGSQLPRSSFSQVPQPTCYWKWVGEPDLSSFNPTKFYRLCLVGEFAHSGCQRLEMDLFGNASFAEISLSSFYPQGCFSSLSRDNFDEEKKLSKAERGGFELVGRVQETCGRDTHCPCIRPPRS